MPRKTEQRMIDAHAFSSRHSDSLKKDKQCGCFYCITVFSPKEITEWLTEKNLTAKKQDGWVAYDQKTALCPFCGVDAIIGESSGYPITKEFLKEMHNYWF